MSKLSTRLRLRKKLLPLGHRFGFYRALSMSVSLAILFAVPLLEIARFDAWGGRHYALGKPVGPVEGAAATLGAIALLYILTFSSNLFVARMFCGWGCPVGQVSRFGEGVEIAGKSGRRRSWAVLESGLFGIALSLSILLWWVDPHVFVAGSPHAIAITLLCLGALVAGTYVHAKVWRWRFCRRICPIGLYYSVVAPSVSYGIVFENELGTCIQCEACWRICPVDLDPRDLSMPRDRAEGLTMSSLPQDNHCLRCGDCITACEFVLRDKDHALVPLHFGVGIKGAPLRHGKECHERNA
jgi:polyferredoxin